ncbi:hypothetical protein DFJ74DRAFT_516349 [Hyaloraphidium curvatum]|nr:hypothetical protein DFJ74DRAFT_516349 [Hyaloraphidium curvatum]
MDSFPDAGQPGQPPLHEPSPQQALKIKLTMSVGPPAKAPTRKSARESKPPPTFSPAAPEPPRVVPQWLRDEMPRVLDDEPPSGPPRWYRADANAPRPAFPFALDPDALPPPSQQLHQTSFSHPPKIDVGKTGGAFLKKTLSEDVPTSNLLSAPKRKRLNMGDGREDAEDEPDDPRRILVIHPGSRFIRIGKVDDALPLTLPHMLARKVGRVTALSDPSPAVFPEAEAAMLPLPEGENPDVPVAPHEQAKFRRDREALRYPPSHLPHIHHARLKATAPRMENDLRARARLLKTRLLTGATASPAVFGYNFEQPREGELVPEVNDRGRMEWTEVWRRPGMPPGGGGGLGKRRDMSGGEAEDCGREAYFGDEALWVPNFSYPPTRCLPVGAPAYKLMHPIKYGMPNTEDYATREAWLDDMEEIWGWSAEQAGVSREERWKWRVIIVVPDAWEKCAWGMLGRVLGSMGFRRAICMQESLAATFAAGYSQNCIVDMGEGKTSVTIVEDGLMVPDTRLIARYGCYDVFILLVHFLTQVSLPFHRPLFHGLVNDRIVLDEIMEKYGNAALGEAMHSLLYESREPEASTRRFEGRAYEEICLAILTYFYPSVIDYRAKLAHFPGFSAEPTWLERDGQVEIAAMDEMVWEGRRKAEEKPLPERPPTAQANGDGTAAPYANGDAVPDVAMDIAEEGTAAGQAQGSAAPAAEQETDPTVPLALDELIVNSLLRYYRYLHSAGARDAEDRLRKVAGQVLLVGGGAQVPGLPELLQERVGQKLNERVVLPLVDRKDGQGLQAASWVVVAVSNRVPRDVDGRIACWKGGSVLGRMDAAKDMWVNWDEWQGAGPARSCLIKWGIPWEEPE